jgi:hypothetical protein
MTDQLEAELTRIRTLPLDPAARWYLLSRFTLTVRAVTSGGPQEGQQAVAELRQAINRTVGVRRPPS